MLLLLDAEALLASVPLLGALEAETLLEVPASVPLLGALEAENLLAGLLPVVGLLLDELLLMAAAAGPLLGPLEAVLGAEEVRLATVDCGPLLVDAVLDGLGVGV